MGSDAVAPLSGCPIVARMNCFEAAVPIYEQLMDVEYERKREKKTAQREER